MKKRLIIFSSSENIKLAEAIQRSFFYKEYLVQIWTNSFFELSKSYISNFKDMKEDYDYAIFICGDDDKIVRNRKTKFVPRDNVILELGMGISTFSLQKVLIVKKDIVSLPTDLDGIETIKYNQKENEPIDIIAGMISSKITDYIVKQSNKDYIKLSWDEYFYHVNNLVNKLKQSAGLGGFYFDIIVGINRGGVMAADIISREYGQIKPVLSLYADRRTGKSVFDSTDLLVDNRYVLKMLQNNKIKNILLVDSFTRDGITIIEAKKYLEKNLNSKTIKSAVIYANNRLKQNKNIRIIDYIEKFKELDDKKLSLSND